MSFWVSFRAWSKMMSNTDGHRTKIFDHSTNSFLRWGFLQHFMFSSGFLVSCSWNFCLFSSYVSWRFQPPDILFLSTTPCHIVNTQSWSIFIIKGNIFVFQKKKSQKKFRLNDTDVEVNKTHISGFCAWHLHRLNVRHKWDVNVQKKKLHFICLRALFPSSCKTHAELFIISHLFKRICFKV